MQRLQTALAAVIVDGQWRVRIDPQTGLPAVLDILTVLTGNRNPRSLWIRIKKRRPDLLPHCSSMVSRGNRTDVIDADGLSILLAELRSLEAWAQRLRQDALAVLLRVIQGDITVAAEVVERNDNPADLEWLQQRVQSKLLHGRLIEAATSRGGKTRYIHRRLNDANNVAVTGFRARELHERRQVKGKRTRDWFEAEELVDLNFLQLHQERSIKRLKPNASNDDLIRVQDAVISGYHDIVNLAQH